MKSRDEILALLSENKTLLSDRFGVQRLAVFGSYARGEPREGSDVDILVEIEPSVGLRFVDLAEYIEELLGMEVDLVSRRAINARYWETIEPELVDVA